MAPPPSAAAYPGGDSLTTTVPPPLQRRNPDHPPYAEMVQAALLSLADPRGSTDSSISRYIVSAYPGIPPGHPNLLPYYLRKLVASGELSVPSPGRYLRPAPNAPPQPPVPRPRLVIRLRRAPSAGDGSGENAVRWCHASAKESVTTAVSPVSENLQIEHGLKLPSTNNVAGQFSLPVSSGRKAQPPAPTYLHPKPHVVCALPAMRQSRSQEAKHDKEEPPPPPVSANLFPSEKPLFPVSSGRKGRPPAPAYLHPWSYVIALPALRQTQRQDAENGNEPPTPPSVSANSLSKAAVRLEEHGLKAASADGVVDLSSVHGSSDRKGELLAPADVHPKPYVVCALPATRHTRSKKMAQVVKHDKEPPLASSNSLPAAAVRPTVMGNLQFEEHGLKLSSADGVMEQSLIPSPSGGKGEPLAPDTAHPGLYVEGALPAPKQNELKELSPDRQTRSEPMTKDAQHDKDTLPAPYVSLNSLSAAAPVPTVSQNSQFEEHGLRSQSVEAVGQSLLPFSSDRKGEPLAPADLHQEPCVVCALPATRSKSVKQDAVPVKEPPPSPPVAANLLSTTAVAPIVSGDLEFEERGLKLSTVDAVVEQSSLSFSSERKGEPLAPPLVHPRPYVECSLPALRQDGSKESSPFRQTWSECIAQDLDLRRLTSEFDQEPPATTSIPMKLQTEPNPKSPSLDLVLEKSSSPASDKKKGLLSTGRTPKARHRRLWYEQ